MFHSAIKQQHVKTCTKKETGPEATLLNIAGIPVNLWLDNVCNSHRPAR